ncbi:MAG: succinylglutamate desuccinylase/aspartoacylase family protein [Azospirillaceae bacterium]
MTKPLTVFGQTTQPGQSSRYRAKVSELNDGTEVTVPVMVHVGAQDGPTVMLSGAIHGDEYNGPASIPRIFDLLDPSTLKGALIAVPVMNPFSYYTRERCASLDYEHLNLNRIWPGDANGLPTQRLAHALFSQCVEQSDYVLDYHEGGVAFLANYIILGGTVETKKKVGDKQLEMARWFGDGMPVDDATIGEAAIRMGRAGALSEAAGSHGIPAIGIEIGGAGTVWPDWVERSVNGSLRILKGLGLIDSAPAETNSSDQIICNTTTWLRPSHGGLIRPYDAAQIHAIIDQGTPLADLLDPFGNVLETLSAPFDSVIMDTRFISTVMPGDWTYKCGKLPS